MFPKKLSEEVQRVDQNRNNMLKFPYKTGATTKEKETSSMSFKGMELSTTNLKELFIADPGTKANIMGLASCTFMTSAQSKQLLTTT